VQTADLDYDLPPDLIAQHPVEPRDSSRLMVIDRAAQAISHRHFVDIADYLQPGDLLVANDTSVLNARLVGRKPTGGKAEVLLLRKLNDTDWEALVGGRRVGQVVLDLARSASLTATVIEKRDGPQSIVRFSQPVEPYLDQIGETPLPPYIHEKLQDKARYQTVYARVAGSAAAPTAGLHFTPHLLDGLRARGVNVAFVTLHVGLDTFKPIEADTVEQHAIHTEWCELPATTAHAIHQTKAQSRRVVAVGTTSMRVLESWGKQLAIGNWTSSLSDPLPIANSQLPISGWSGFTNIFITPGFIFSVADALITNYHLPRSTLLALVGAFMGMDLMKRAYAEAIRERYRFYSFGDAMLIV
jgi:S-adenosylmethionine:tRNA ribosyltransferase-isomerase